MGDANDAATTRRQVRARVKSLRAAVGLSEPAPGFRRRVREVIVVASSSRGGSSFFAELLRRSSGLIHLRGELTPFLALCGQTYPESGTGSDALRADMPDDQLDEVGDELAYDCGVPTDVLRDETDVARFALDLTTRLTIQWSKVDFDRWTIERCLRQSLDTLEKLYRWPRGGVLVPSIFHSVFLRSVQSFYPETRPEYYDLGRLGERAPVPDAEAALGPPAPFLFEEPPFIGVSPWRLASTDELTRKPLVIKTPSNAYRLGYLKALFPNAVTRTLHLTRNPAASINGLCDGWRHRAGFFSHRVAEPLQVEGYSDVYPDWGQHWWKFDLPPNWQSYREAPLERVCAFQWSQAHRTILEHLHSEGRDGSPSMRVKFEDLVHPHRSLDTVRRLQRWLRTGVRSHDVKVETGPMPIVMATSPPARARWRQRRSAIEPLTQCGELRQLAEELEYGHDISAWD